VNITITFDITPTQNVDFDAPDSKPYQDLAAEFKLQVCWVSSYIKWIILMNDEK
jgi:hypothetical protein